MYVILINTVKPVFYDHPTGPEKVVFISQVVFYQRHKYAEMKVYVPAEVVLHEMWSLILVVLKHRFHCIGIYIPKSPYI